MFNLIDLASFAQRYRARRANRQLSGIISGLSENLQKDIGWPSPERRQSDEILHLKRISRLG